LKISRERGGDWCCIGGEVDKLQKKKKIQAEDERRKKRRAEEKEAERRRGTIEPRFDWEWSPIVFLFISQG
jgi:hypothetical protein